MKLLCMRWNILTITVEIHDAISDVEELVFKGFDSAVKEYYKRLVW